VQSLKMESWKWNWTTIHQKTKGRRK